LGGIVIPSGGNNLIGRNALLDPPHHGKQNIVFGVPEARDTVDT
jgi:hypothetical protein